MHEEKAMLLLKDATKLLLLLHHHLRHQDETIVSPTILLMTRVTAINTIYNTNIIAYIAVIIADICRHLATFADILSRSSPKIKRDMSRTRSPYNQV